ncbi:MAG TPA: hypothetical protein VNQ73_18025 [Ilumatobacter sp.]|nr:hypothetical protein [Ilumatobacter sp.]
MGTGVIVTALVLIALAGGGAVAVQRSRRAFKLAGSDRDPTPDPRAEAAARNAAVRLTSGALRELPVPMWRVVYEIGAGRLTGTEHVLVGPPGVFAVTTTIDPLPGEAAGDPDPVAVARAAMTRGGLDDALAAVQMSSTGLLAVHWGGAPAGSAPTCAGVHGVTHVDGRRLAAWATSLSEATLTPAQVDLAWQTVVRSIGRPDPLP